MATAAQLKAMRKKYGLGEFKKKKKSKNACKKSRACKGKYRTSYKRRKGGSRSSSPAFRAKTYNPPTMPNSMFVPHAPSSAIFYTGPMNQSTMDLPTRPGAISAPMPSLGATTIDTPVRSVQVGDQMVTYWQRPDGSLYKQVS